jgi:CRP-like cAMP-binding protein
VSDSPLDRNVQKFAAGTVLFREGEPGDVMYVIQSGEVEIRRRVGAIERILAVLLAGEFFGEMSIVSGQTRSATAVVRAPARLLVITPETFSAMLLGKPEIAVRMMRALATRLEQANQQIELLLLANPNQRVVQYLRRLAEEQLASSDEKNLESAVYLPVQLSDIAQKVALPSHEVADVMESLRTTRLVMDADEAGIAGPGFVIPEVKRLLEFLEILELKAQYRHQRP